MFAATGLHAQVAGRLSGSVVDQTGAAIPGATVNVFVPGGKEPVLSATTNEAGLFSFIAVRPDTYDVAVEAKGFTKSMMRLVKVIADSGNRTRPHQAGSSIRHGQRRSNCRCECRATQ